MADNLTRRGMIAGIAGLASGAALAAEPAFAGTAEERKFAAIPQLGSSKRPNILVILGDDLGWADLSSYGSTHIATPHLDGLAKGGIRFTDGYSAAAVCSPTRIALYTGRYPGRLPGGLPEPISAHTDQNGIPPEHPTLASLLKGVGYDTAMFGKWHCGFLPWFSPLRSGWDEFFGNFSGAVDYYSKVDNSGTLDLYEGEVPAESIEYYTDTIGDRAAEYVRRSHAVPWLLNLNFTSPHWPWEAPGDRATSAELTARAKAGDTAALFHFDGGSLDIYRKMVENMDHNVGKVLAALRETGQERDTIVLFSSDNGGERFSYYWPLSGGKGNLNEGGIRVPNILRWPARLRARQVSHEPIVTQDWTATLLELAGARPDPAYPGDGRSFAGYLLRGEKAPDRDLFWRTVDARALRHGDWKYLRATTDADDALFNIRVDPREQADLSAKNPATLASLQAKWDAINATLIPYS
ncbi:arylsulfatase A-like enzyme [Actinoplanes tereljensis]|uniref:N-acetylgalactosamine-6-sulfatase n=1 Tax=Paractinoplanes tereljensis TaxID=571912 RepID=A0A919NNT7_9ACTN|nr:sulfatase-like hydrolase/transferase [Actinoplanes tereljensis]GIF21583.1 N-acetylgalactosamine-6-sulfatase [Actinoplanes tereljensis]